MPNISVFSGAFCRGDSVVQAVSGKFALWIKQWLVYSSSISYASAMTGAPDYATFKNGWWALSDNLQKMRDTIDLKEQLKKVHQPLKSEKKE